jgi:hypothetical protein
MPEQKENKSKNQSSGYLLILIGIIGLVIKFIGEPNWNTIGIIKIVIPISAIVFGIWTVFKKK